MLKLKICERALRFVSEITGSDEKTAKAALDESRHVATACVMISKNCSQEQAQKLLQQNGGILRKIIK